MAEERLIVNAVVRQTLLASQVVLGESGLHAVLKVAGLERFIDHIPPDDMKPGMRISEYARFNRAIETSYGRAGKGILQRIGRASFQYGVGERSGLLVIAGTALKLLTQKKRIKFILTSLVNAVKATNPAVEVWAGEVDGKLTYVEKTCAFCFGGTSNQPICHMNVGYIGEAVKWATGRDYLVVETHCVATGDPHCCFEIGGLNRP
jgi:predicted hydrocarbon binding protein